MKSTLIFITIFFTVLLYATPQLYATLGNKLAVLKENCTQYKDASKINIMIKIRCKKYNILLNKAFKVGYKLNSHTSESRSLKYLNLLNQADDEYENLLPFILSQIDVSREKDNLSQYIKLIQVQGKTYKLTQQDYLFMDKYPDAMKKNKRYQKYREKIQDQKREEKRKIEAIQAQRSKERKKRHTRIQRQANEDLKRQMNLNKIKKSSAYISEKKCFKALNIFNNLSYANKDNIRSIEKKALITLYIAKNNCEKNYFNIIDENIKEIEILLSKD